MSTTDIKVGDIAEVMIQFEPTSIEIDDVNGAGLRYKFNKNTGTTTITIFGAAILTRHPGLARYCADRRNIVVINGGPTLGFDADDYRLLHELPMNVAIAIARTSQLGREMKDLRDRFDDTQSKLARVWECSHVRA